MRSKLVRNDGPLPRVARYLGLDKFIIRAPSEKLTEKKLADHMEALLGAIFKDSGENYEIVKVFIANKWSLLGLNEDNLSVSDFGNASLTQSENISAKREEQLNRALLKAASIGDTDRVDLLMGQSAFIEARDEQGNTPILLAYTNSHSTLMQYLYDEYHANIDAVNEQGLGIIHIAAFNGDNETIDFLIENMAEINLATKTTGDTAGHYAASNDHLSVIKQLYANGADFNIRNKLGKDVRQVAIDKKCNDTVLFIDTVTAEQRQLDQQLLELVEKTSEYELYTIKQEILVLLEKGANPFAKDKKNRNVFQIIMDKSSDFSSYSNLNYEILKGSLPREGENLDKIKLKSIDKIEQLDLSKMHLIEADFSGSTLVDVKFIETCLMKANFDRASFTRVDFTGAEIASGIFTHVTMDRESFESFVSAAKACKDLIKVSIRFSAIDLSNISLNGFDLKGLSFYRTRFNKITFCSVLDQLKKGASFEGTVDLRGVNLEDVDLTGVMLTNVILDSVTLKSLLPQLRKKSLKLTKATFLGSDANPSHFVKREFRPIFDNLDLSGLALVEMNFSTASLVGAKLRNADLSRSNVSGCDFNGADIYGTCFEEVKLDKIALHSILEQNKHYVSRRLILSRTTIQSCSYLNMANLDLSQAKLTSSSKEIEFVNFENSKLTEVDLRGARLRFVNLTKTDLTNADLSEVTFKDVTFRDTIIEGAKLSSRSLMQLLPYIKAKHLALKNVIINREDFTRKVMYPNDGTYNLSIIDFSEYNIEAMKIINSTLSIVNFLSLLPLLREGRVQLLNATLSDMDLSGLDLSNLDLTGITLINVNLTNTNLSGSNLQKAKLKNVRLLQTNLQNADLTGCVLTSVAISNPKLSGTILTGANIDRTTLDRLLVYIKKNIISLVGVNLNNTNRYFPSTSNTEMTLTLTGIEFNDIDLHDVTFQDFTSIDKKFLLSILPQLKANQLTLKGLVLNFDLKNIDLTNLSFDGVIINNIAFKTLCMHPNAKNFNLRGLRFIEGTRLRAEDLPSLDMAGVDLTGVLLNRNHVLALLPLLKPKAISLKGANLCGADLNRLDLSGVSFEDANLQNASLMRTNLTGCNLTQAHIAGANFTSARLDDVDFTKTSTQYTLAGLSVINTRRPTTFKDASMRQVNLTRVNWHYNVTDLTVEQLIHAGNLDHVYLDDKLSNELSMKVNVSESNPDQNSNQNDAEVTISTSMTGLKRGKHSVPMPSPDHYPYFFLNSNSFAQGQTFNQGPSPTNNRDIAPRDVNDNSKNSFGFQ